MAPYIHIITGTMSLDFQLRTQLQLKGTLACNPAVRGSAEEANEYYNAMRLRGLTTVNTRCRARYHEAEAGNQDNHSHEAHHMHDMRMKYNTVQIEAQHDEHDRPTRACEANKRMPV